MAAVLVPSVIAIMLGKKALAALGYRDLDWLAFLAFWLPAFIRCRRLPNAIADGLPTGARSTRSRAAYCIDVHEPRRKIWTVTQIGYDSVCLVHSQSPNPIHLGLPFTDQYPLQQAIA
ncbi:hypothetical protein [Novosphingobium sp. UBA1939]|uniref:hypothetical protein n=1 Tax=Novosphingobium sp. UBA1939 TaxID=1946982 RepID=UPI0025D77812|nr:hypothetical protein [Novosphingobium sp. UBA1939]